MPLYRDFSNDDTTIWLWKYDASETLDEAELLEVENFEKVKNYHPQKKIEVLMVRQMLQKLKPNTKILYHERQPYLSPEDGVQISITHSFPFAAIALSSKKIGIDIERFKEKIRRVQDKFLFEEEAVFIPKNDDIKFLTIIWSLKESLYKLHHSKYWSLKRHYTIAPFHLEGLREVKCVVHDQYFRDEYKARVEFFDDYCFTVVVD